MVTMAAMTRTTLDLEPTLFPLGIPPESLVEVMGATATERTYLVTYLMAKLVTTYPEKRAVFIDTRQSFCLDNFVSILSHLVPALKGIKKQAKKEEWKFHPGLAPFMERITIMSCYSAEDLLFCFGPKNSGQLEKMLDSVPNYSCIFVDTLDSFTYCPSLTNVTSSNYPDFVGLLKRSVKDTSTPVICVMSNTHKSISQEEASSSSSYNAEERRDAPLVFSNISFDKSYFTHSLFLQRTDEIRQFSGEAISSEEASEPEFKIKAHLRSKKSPSIALSAASHCVKFSILSGIFNVLVDTDDQKR